MLPTITIMCLILFAYRCRKDYPLIIAANRDEYYARPSMPARFWPEQPGLLAGKDLVAGGTWLGVTRRNRLAAVTNVRDPGTVDGIQSRGALCHDFLTDRRPATAFAHSLRNRAHHYSGFNVLLWDGSSLLYATNRRQQAMPLEPGIYGLSNGYLNEAWPKVENGRLALERAISGNFSVTDCLAVLADRTQPADVALPDTGVGLAMERYLAPRFICSDTQPSLYGTRVSSVLWLHHSGRAGLTERSFDTTGSSLGEQQFEFSMTPTGPSYTGSRAQHR